MVEAEKESEPGVPAPVKRFEILSLVPIASIVLALFSLYVSEVARSDVARLDEIKTEYSLFHQLAQLQVQYPIMSHLFGNSEAAYDDRVADIRSLAKTMSDQDRTRNLLQERALAHFIFTTYEETYYLWKGGTAQRRGIAEDDLVSLSRSFCRNPRLLWYWDAHGGQLDVWFADELRDYFDTNVLRRCPDSRTDAVGPFGQ